MPNWVHNRLVVTGGSGELARFVAAAEGSPIDEETGERPPLDFERHVPTPAELLVTSIGPASSPVRTPKGDIGWYSWRRENWGPKWNAKWPSREGGANEGRVTYTFATAWAPPEPWLRAVSSLHPVLTFELESVEEYLQASGGCRWKGGELVARWRVDPTRSEWIELLEDEEEGD